jgi:transcriptional regulator with XRE-family HTH domain/quercetin dioxygenase-like cupin family protein
MADVARVPRPDYPEIGEHLRARRHERGLSLRELADRLGVSPSLISQIERGRANPSVSTLYAIVAELDISLDELLFDRRVERSSAGDAQPNASVPEPPSGPIQRSNQRTRIRLASGVIWERLTTRSEPGTEFLYVIYEVGGASSPEDAYQRHAGHEWGYVLSGSLRVTIAFEDYVLQPGDAVSLESTTPHRLVNAGDTPVHAIWFVEGRDPHDAAKRRRGLSPVEAPRTEPDRPAR